MFQKGVGEVEGWGQWGGNTGVEEEEEEGGRGEGVTVLEEPRRGCVRGGG